MASFRGSGEPPSGVVGLGRSREVVIRTWDGSWEASAGCGCGGSMGSKEGLLEAPLEDPLVVLLLRGVADFDFN